MSQKLFPKGEDRDPEKLCKFINPDTGERCKAFRWGESEEEFCIYHAKDISKNLDIIKAIENPNIFGTFFGEDQESIEGWKSILAGAFGLELSGDRLRTFKKLTGRTKRPSKQVKELWIISGRRSYKSTICSALAIFFSLYANPKVKKKQKVHVIVVAPNRENTKVIMDTCKSILELQPKLGKRVKKYLRESIEFDNGMVIDVRTSSIISGRGLTSNCIIFEEANFFPQDEYGSVNPAVEILSSLYPCTATLKDAMIIGISSAYSKSGLMYNKWEKFYGQNSDEVLIIQAKTTDLNPLMSEQFINSQLKEDYERNSAEYLSIWRTDVSQFIPDQVLTNSIVPNRVMISPQPDVRYIAYTDGASGSASKGADSFTLAIAHKDSKTGQTIISGVWDYRPPFSPKAVIKEYAKICKKYGVKEVVGDKWSLGVLGDLWSMEGINYRTNDISTSETYQEALVFLSTGTVELLDDQRSINQLRGLERYVRSSGKDHVSHRTNSHDDLATVIMGCIYVLNEGIKTDLDSMPLPSLIDSVPMKPSLEKIMRKEEDIFVQTVKAGRGVKKYEGETF